MKILYIILILFLPFAIQAQKPSDTDVAEVEALLDSAYEKTTIVDMKSSALFAQEALEQSKETGYIKGEAWSNFYLAQALFELMAYKQFLDILRKAESINKNVADQFLSFEIYRVRSRIYASMQLIDAANREQKKGLRVVPLIQKSEKDKAFLTSLAYENLIVNYSKTEKKDSLYYYLNKNENLLKNLDPSLVYPNLITLHGLLGVYYSDKKDFDKSEYYFKKSESIAKQYNFPYISFTYRYWGDMELNRNQPKAALLYFEKSLDILNKTNFRNEIPYVYNKLALTYKELGDENKAKDYKIKALELQNELKTEQLETNSTAVEEILKNQMEIEAVKSSKGKIILWGIIFVLTVLVSVLLINYFKAIKSKNLKKEIIKQQQEELVALDKGMSELHQKVNESFEEVIQLAKDNNPQFFTRFREVYPEVIQKLLEIDPKLRVTELTLLAYFFLGFTSKDVALYTFKSTNTVRNRRQNLRNKLHLSTDENMELWLKSLADS